MILKVQAANYLLKKNIICFECLAVNSKIYSYFNYYIVTINFEFRVHTLCKYNI